MEEPRRLGGRYELGQVLGRGGMAEVYLAHDTRLGRTVAVKTLRADLARDPTFQARFRREAQSAASLNHPAIVAVYDTGEDYIDGVSIPYIVMEYVDGSTLRELLHSGRKLLPERAMEMTVGILQGLEYAHRNGIVHRDIKPANVMLTRNGQVKVMDFGIARAMGDSGMTMTQTAAVIGTAQYLSPEQAKGEQVDARSDLYSTGCLLYELLTVRPPFVGDSPVAVAYQHVREDPQPPSVFDPEITPGMDAIVLRALVKDPNYRYQSADEMRADIEACLDGQPVGATAAMGSVGYGGGYPDDQPTTALRSEPGAGATTMLPPMNPDDGGYGYDDRPDRRRQRKNNTSTILLAVAAVLVLIGAILIGKWAVGGNGGVGNGTVAVPQFVGKSEADAQKQAANSDLKLNVTRKPCEDQAKGDVCSQDPAFKKEVDKGTTVNVVVSTGAPQVDVLDVKGLDFDKARSDLEAKGFKVERKTEESDRTPNVVIDQDPKGGTERDKGSTVTLTVAVAPAQVPVPDLSGKTPQQAQDLLEQAGLKLGSTQEEESDAQPDGTVFWQSFQPDQKVDPGTTVNVKVAKAAQKARMPKVKGGTLAVARQKLAQRGFTNVQVAPGNPGDDNAIVTGQNPQPGDEFDDPANTPVVLNTISFGGNNNGGGIFGGASG
ncbi:Stk1 family PASTA domain-containing Ser/Thr kinase [Streptomyces sp. MS06]|uniref:Stk1 family PASTA domain-containing Ser/Thr kinase n=1 Tax=Streptomyces sp. MS06 TaxID=3385974 RepID=UPI0039A2EC58